MEKFIFNTHLLLNALSCKIQRDKRVNIIKRNPITNDDLDQAIILKSQILTITKRLL
jgi:hypothetical protein